MRKLMNNIMTIVIAVLLIIPVMVNQGAVIAAESESQEITNVFEYDVLFFGNVIFVGEIEIEADIKMKLTSNVKSSVKPGESIYIESYMDLEFDENVIEALRENNVEAISGNLTGFDIANENGNEVYNAADTPLEIPKTSFPEEGPLKVRLPFEGGIQTGPFTASQEGNLTIQAGELDGVITIYGIPILGKVDLGLSGKLASGENSNIVEIPIKEDNEVDPILPALKAVNEAEDVDALWKALSDETLALNLKAVEKYNTYKKTKLAERIIEKRAEADGFENEEAVQNAVNSSNFELFIQPGRPQDPVETAFNAVNNATDVEAMKIALENEALELNLEAYQSLSSDNQMKVVELVLENRPENEEGYPLPSHIQTSLNDAINDINELVVALNMVNEAEDIDALWKALSNETLAINLKAVEKYNTYKKVKLAERILEKRAEVDGFENAETVQKAVNSSNFELFIQPGRPQDPVETAFNAVNNATDVEEMRVALENEDLGLNLGAYQALSSDNQMKVAELVLENRPENEEGYPLPKNIQEALEQAITKLTESEEPDDSDEIDGTWLIGEGKPNTDQGNEKDLYLDILTFDVYQKIGKDWNLIDNLKGSDGADGEDGDTWLFGEGYPSEGMGNTGDLYLETSTGVIYIKSVDGWKVVADIQGPSNETEDNEKPEDNPKEEPSEIPEIDVEDSNLIEDESSDEKGEKLPSTATMYPLMILIGLLVTMLGGVLLYVRKNILSSV